MIEENDKSILTDKQEHVGDILNQKHRINVFSLPAGLCFSCSYSHITRTKHEQKYRIACTYNFDNLSSMPEDIDYCNKYELIGSQTLDDLKRMATPIEKDKKAPAGFTVGTNDGDKNETNKSED